MSVAPVAGIDVGGERKGFHAVVLGEASVSRFASPHAEEIVAWCVAQGAVVVAVDAPCAWSVSGKSRLAERELVIAGAKVHCFATPSRAPAQESVPPHDASREMGHSSVSLITDEHP